MTGEKLELRAPEVDINPQYADSLEIEAFTMHLAFESTFGEAEGAGGGKGESMPLIHQMLCRCFIL